jgi:Uma2 family endonuclease
MSITPAEMKLVLGLEHAGMLMAPEEFDAVEECDRNYRYELIDGRLVVTPSPLEAERDPNEELGRLLRNYQEQHPQGRALDKTLPEQTIPTLTNRRRADRAIWTGLGHAPIPATDLPTIVAEFVSEALRDRKRDYEEKRDEYREIGIGEYWVFDRFRRTLTVFINDPAGPRELAFGANDVYRTLRLPGFELPLARLFALADQWN